MTVREWAERLLRELEALPPWKPGKGLEEVEREVIVAALEEWAKVAVERYREKVEEELHDILDKAVNGLAPPYRTVFVLRDMEGLSTEETAEALQLSVPAVKSRLLRARLQLRERLNRYFKKKKDGVAKP